MRAAQQHWFDRLAVKVATRSPPRSTAPVWEPRRRRDRDHADVDVTTGTLAAPVTRRQTLLLGLAAGTAGVAMQTVRAPPALARRPTICDEAAIERCQKEAAEKHRDRIRECLSLRSGRARMACLIGSTLGRGGLAAACRSRYCTCPPGTYLCGVTGRVAGDCCEPSERCSALLIPPIAVCQKLCDDPCAPEWDEASFSCMPIDCGSPCLECQDGTCVSRCGEGQNCCGDACSDPRTDSRNCGGCGTSCGSNQRCENGVCVNNPGCGAVCMNDPRCPHAGEFFDNEAVCAADCTDGGLACVFGFCQPAC